MFKRIQLTEHVVWVAVAALFLLVILAGWYAIDKNNERNRKWEEERKQNLLECMDKVHDAKFCYEVIFKYG